MRTEEQLFAFLCYVPTRVWIWECTRLTFACMYSSYRIVRWPLMSIAAEFCCCSSMALCCTHTTMQQMNVSKRVWLYGWTDGRIVGRSMFVVHAWCWANVVEDGAAYIGSSNRSCCSSSKSCLVLCEFLRFTIQLKFCEWSELFKLYIYYMYINCSTMSIDVYLHITYFIYVCIWIGLYYLRFAAQLLLVDLESTWT